MFSLLPDAGVTAGVGVPAESQRGDDLLAEPLVGYSRPLSPWSYCKQNLLGWNSSAVMLCDPGDGVIIVGDADFLVTTRSDAEFYPCNRVTTGGALRCIVMFFFATRKVLVGLARYIFASYQPYANTLHHLVILA